MDVVHNIVQMQKWIYIDCIGVMLMLAHRNSFFLFFFHYFFPCRIRHGVD